jgi:hypothetical protein
MQRNFFVGEIVTEGLRGAAGILSLMHHYKGNINV